MRLLKHGEERKCDAGEYLYSVQNPSINYDAEILYYEMRITLLSFYKMKKEQKPYESVLLFLIKYATPSVDDDETAFVFEEPRLTRSNSIPRVLDIQPLGAGGGGKAKRQRSISRPINITLDVIPPTSVDAEEDA
jgi:hypothetical protein